MVHRTMYSDEEDSQEDNYVNYKQKYRELKKNLRYLIYENECFQDELRKAQHNFVNISRDKSFLLDRILKYEKPQGASSDSEATESSEEDDDTKTASSSQFFPPKKKITKRKKSEVEIHNGNSNVSSETLHGDISPKQLVMKQSHSSKLPPGKGNMLVRKPKKSTTSRKPSVSKKEKEVANKTTVEKNLINSQMLRYDINNVQIENEEQVDTTDQELSSNPTGVHFGFPTMSGNEERMTREQVERHLESKRFSPEFNTTATVPAELFSHEPDPESDFEDGEICEFIQLEEDGISADMILE